MSRLAFLRLILVLILAAVSMSVFTADTGKQAPATAQSSQSSEEIQETSPTATDADPAAQETSPASGTAAQPIKEFKPTEKIEADSAVSFPIDI